MEVFAGMNKDGNQQAHCEWCLYLVFEMNQIRIIDGGHMEYYDWKILTIQVSGWILKLLSTRLISEV